MPNWGSKIGNEKPLLLKNTGSSLGPTGTKSERKPDIYLHFMSVSLTLTKGIEVSHFINLSWITWHSQDGRTDRHLHVQAIHRRSIIHDDDTKLWSRESFYRSWGMTGFFLDHLAEPELREQSTSSSWPGLLDSVDFCPTQNLLLKPKLHIWPLKNDLVSLHPYICSSSQCSQLTFGQSLLFINIDLLVMVAKLSPLRCWNTGFSAWSFWKSYYYQQI